MQNYVEERGDEIEENGDQRINPQENVGEASDSHILGESVDDQPNAAEISSQEAISQEQSFDNTAENVEVDPRRFGLMRLMVGILISSVACNLIIGGNPKFYGVLALGLIWVVIGFKEFLFPKRSSENED